MRTGALKGTDAARCSNPLRPNQSRRAASRRYDLSRVRGGREEGRSRAGTQKQGRGMGGGEEVAALGEAGKRAAKPPAGSCGRVGQRGYSWVMYSCGGVGRWSHPGQSIIKHPVLICLFCCIWADPAPDDVVPLSPSPPPPLQVHRATLSPSLPPPLPPSSLTAGALSHTEPVWCAAD